MARGTTAAEIVEAIADERQRFHSIMSCGEADRRPKAALRLAMQGLNLETAKDFLRDLPAEANAFEQAMGAEQINIGSSKASMGLGTDAKAARLAELKAAGAGFGRAMGYRI